MDNFALIYCSEDNQLSFSATKTIIFNNKYIYLSANSKTQIAENDSFLLVFCGKILFPSEIVSALTDKYSPDNQANNILLLYQTMQSKAFALLKGIWSVVILDKQTHSFIAASDPIGNQALYYFVSDNIFAIASTPQTIYNTLPQARTLDIPSIQNYLCWGNISNHNQHFYADIERLQPSCYLIYHTTDNTFSINKYYTLPFKACTAPYNEYEEPYFADKLRLQIIDSIKVAFANKPKMAIGLSGGLDSSSIACVAHRFCPDTQLTAFTMVNNEDGGEAFWAEKIIKQTDIQWIKVSCDTEYIKHNIQKVIAAQGIPLFSLSTVAQYQVMESVYQAGFSEIADGQGADELLGGYNIFFLPFLHFLRSQWLVKDYLQEIFHLHRANISWKDICLWRMKEIAKKHYFNSIRLLQKNNPIAYQCIKPQPIATNCSIPKVVLNEYLYEQYTQNLPHITRWGVFSANAFDIDCLMPFSYSVALAECAFQIPSTQKIHHGWSKYMLRQAMTGIVDETVLWRKGKMGFHIPEYQWYHQLESFFKTYIEQIAHDDIVDIATLLQHWHEAYEKNIHFRRFVFRVYCYLLWKYNL